MFTFIITLAIIIIYIGCLYYIAFSASKQAWIQRLISYPPALALTLAIYATTWTYYGSVGTMASTGSIFLAIYIGPILVFLFFNKYVERIIQLKSEYKFTSIADFLSTRYDKSFRVATVVTLLCTIGMIPYISLQLRAVIDTLTIISNGHGSNISVIIGPILAVLMILFTIIFGVRKLDPSECHPGMMTAIAVQSIIKLLFFLLCGIFVTFFMFDGFNDIVSALPIDYSLSQNGSSSVVSWISYILIAMSAILFLPRQFHVTFVENSSKSKFNSARWYFIIYMLLINIFVIPIAYAGIAKGLDIEAADTFVLHLPLLADNNFIALLVFIGGFSAAASMIMLSTMTLSTMLSNHVVLPIISSFSILEPLKKEVLKIRWLLVILIISISYLFIFKVSEINSLVNIGIISFVAIFLLVPSAVGAIVWKRGTKSGAVAGMILGFLIWAYTLILPLFEGNYPFVDNIISNGIFGIKILQAENLFNLNLKDNISNAVIWSFASNLFFYVSFSLFSKQSVEEKQLADKFGFYASIDKYIYNLKNINETIELDKKVDKILGVFNNYFDEMLSIKYLNICLANCDLNIKRNISVLDLAKLHNESEKLLSGAIGSAVANNELKEAKLFDESEQKALQKIYANLLVDLKLPPEEMLRKIDYYQEKDFMQQQYSHELEKKIKERESEIEERKKIEIKLRTAEKKYRGIFENAVEGIYQSTLDGKFIQVNPALAQILGYKSPNDLINNLLNLGKDLYVKENDRMRFIEKLKANNVLNNFEVELYKKDSSQIWVSISGRLIKQEDLVNDIIEGTIIDISERKRTEQALINAKEKAERTDKLKSNFLAQMSHEIRTPINTILNFTSLLKMETKDKISEEANECFVSIENGANRLLRTIDLILNMSDLDAGTYQPNIEFINLIDDILDPIIKEFSHAAENKGLKLILENKIEEKIIISLDRYTMTQTFANLVDNSIKYTNQGTITIIVYKIDKNVAVNVTDTGIGISEEFIPQIFNKFSQEEEGYTRKYEGNGLGLALVQRYSELNNTKIDVYSKKGKGTTFSILFPIS